MVELDIQTFEQDIIEKPIEYFETKDYSAYFNHYNTLQTYTIFQQFILGKLYFNGIGTNQNYEQAIHWYTLSANQGYSRAQNNLGIYYYSIEKDYEQAIHWFTLSANQGNSKGQYGLGIYYEEIEQDYEQALHWYTLANDTEKIKNITNILKYKSKT